MNAIATTTFSCGPFTVQVRPRLDNPAWAMYVVLRAEKLIGKQFSIPTESDCRWLEFQREHERTVYAERPCYGIVYSSVRITTTRRKFATARNAQPKRDREPD